MIKYEINKHKFVHIDIEVCGNGITVWIPRGTSKHYVGNTLKSIFKTVKYHSDINHGEKITCKENITKNDLIGEEGFYLHIHKSIYSKHFKYSTGWDTLDPEENDYNIITLEVLERLKYIGED